MASTLLFLPRNWIPLYASVPVLVFLFGYSYAKRFTLLSHFWLGAALMLAPLAAWVAIRGGDWLRRRWCLGGAVLFWVAGFDIIYACQDFEFDVKMRLRSIPARFGVAAALRMAAVCHLAMVVLLLAVAAGVSLFRLDLFGRRRGDRRAVGLRTSPRPARRSDPRQSGVFPRQRRGERGVVGGRGGGFDVVDQG